jgi:hypothetical protein
MFLLTYLYQTPNEKLTLAAAFLSLRTKCNSSSLSLGHQWNGGMFQYNLSGRQLSKLGDSLEKMRKGYKVAAGA